MNKKETILAFSVLALALVLIVGVFTLSPEPKAVDKPATNTAEHDETNSDGHHNTDNSELGELVDLTSQSEVSMDIKDFKYEQPNIRVKKRYDCNLDQSGHSATQCNERTRQ